MNVFFCGTGGTGKSSVLSIVAEKLGLRIKPSVVRGFYASQGFSSQEQVNALPPRDQQAFQLELMRYYLREVTAFVLFEGRDGMVMDRSIYCHAAYTLLADLSAPASLIAEVDHIFKMFEKLRPRVFYFPYPVPWQDATEDGFRAVNQVYDFTHDAILRRWVNHQREGTILVPIYPPETRAGWIASICLGMRD